MEVADDLGYQCNLSGVDQVGDQAMGLVPEDTKATDTTASTSVFIRHGGTKFLRHGSMENNTKSSRRGKSMVRPMGVMESNEGRAVDHAVELPAKEVSGAYDEKEKEFLDHLSGKSDPHTR